MMQRTIQLFLVMASSILCLIATDILLPSLPQIALSFAVSANDVKMLISIFIIGQFTTVLLWGIIADYLGRRPTLFLGMMVFLCGSLLSLYSHSLTIFLLSRFIQGMGAVVVPVAGWALIQDLFPKNEGARIMAWIGTLVAIIPLFAPALGGILDVHYGWHANLYCIAVYASVLCLLLFLLPQQQKHPRGQFPKIKERLGVYGMIMKHRTFLSYITLFGLLNSGEWCFLTMAPFYYSHRHITPDVMGLLLMITAMGFVFGSLVASKLITRFGVDKVIALGIHLAILSSIILIVGQYLRWADQYLFHAIDIGMYIFSSALLWGGTTSKALQCFDDYRGSASAVRSLILLCFAVVGTYSGRIIDHHSLYPVAFFLLFMAACALFVFNNKEFKASRLTIETA